MMDVYWLQQSEADVPAEDDWLCESEAVRLSGFHFAKRRADWRLGRWTAKCAVAASLERPNDHPSLKLIEIIPASTGQPKVTIVGNGDAVSISISHRSGIAMCAVAVGDGKLGCDLEIVEPRSDAFIADYFTQEEQVLIARTDGERRPLLVSLLWSAKESALKALQVGLRADTRSVSVTLNDSQRQWFGATDARSTEAGRPSELSNASGTSWRALQVHCDGGTDFRGWWQHAGNVVQTVIAAPPAEQPIELRCPTR